MIREYSTSAGKGKKPMPIWARIVAAVMGLLLLTAGIGALLVVRPLDAKVVMGGVAALGLGLDFTGGALSARWPIALQWMPFI